MSITAHRHPPGLGPKPRMYRRSSGTPNCTPAGLVIPVLMLLVLLSVDSAAEDEVAADSTQECSWCRRVISRSAASAW